MCDFTTGYVNQSSINPNEYQFTEASAKVSILDGFFRQFFGL